MLTKGATRSAGACAPPQNPVLFCNPLRVAVAGACAPGRRLRREAFLAGGPAGPGQRRIRRAAPMKSAAVAVVDTDAGFRDLCSTLEGRGVRDQATRRPFFDAGQDVPAAPSLIKWNCRGWTGGRCCGPARQPRDAGGGPRRRLRGRRRRESWRASRPGPTSSSGALRPGARIYLSRSCGGSSGHALNVVELGELRMDLDARTASSAGKPSSSRAAEFDLRPISAPARARPDPRGPPRRRLGRIGLRPHRRQTSKPSAASSRPGKRLETVVNIGYLLR